MNNDSDIYVSIPETIQHLTSEKKDSVLQYLKQLDQKEIIAYKIAMEHLGSSFHITRSNGYQEWVQKKK